MPSILEALATIRLAESVVGRLTNAERVALLDEYFPDSPAKELAGLVKGLGS